MNEMALRGAHAVGVQFRPLAESFWEYMNRTPRDMTHEAMFTDLKRPVTESPSDARGPRALLQKFWNVLSGS